MHQEQGAAKAGADIKLNDIKMKGMWALVTRKDEDDDGET